MPQVISLGALKQPLTAAPATGEPAQVTLDVTTMNRLRQGDVAEVFLTEGIQGPFGLDVRGLQVQVPDNLFDRHKIKFGLGLVGAAGAALGIGLGWFLWRR